MDDATVLRCFLGETKEGDLPGVFWLEGRVAKVELPNYNLKGKIDLAKLDKCRVLCLFGNELRGRVALPSSLIHLDLSRNNFGGDFPAAILCLFQLKRLHLEHNRLTGALPELHLAKLEVFTAFDNNFQGDLPSFEYCPKLKKLWLHNNKRLTGTFEAFLSNNDLKSLMLTHTSVKGPVSQALLDQGCRIQHTTHEKKQG